MSEKKIELAGVCHEAAKKTAMKRYRVLNLGAGVQSTALYLMAMYGELEPIDVAIFADVQEEPNDVYEHLTWLRSLGGPEIVTVTAGRLGDALKRGTDARGNRINNGEHFISIPAFVRNADQSIGMIRRQCTHDFKVAPVEKEIRVRFGNGPGKPLPADVHVTQLMGLSFDEPKRVIRVQQRFMEKPKNWTVEFPLWDEQMTRHDCVSYLQRLVPHEVPRSACVFCPFKTDAEWRHLRDTNAHGWQRAIEIDTACRRGEGFRGQRFLHQSCVPLADVDLRGRDEKSGQQKLGFMNECEGYCGN